MNPSQFQSAKVSRRRVLSLAAGAATLAVVGAPLRRAVAQATPTASPVATPAAVASLPLPSTLAADASPQFRAVAEAVVAAMRQHQVPGAAIGLLIGDREEHATFGVTSISSLRPVTPETLFQIGSLSKTYTSTAIWRLIDEGALALDAPVRTYIPDLKLKDEATAAKVTVANLLDHSSGIYGDDEFDMSDSDDALARYVSERLPQLPQLFPVGSFFSYNNVGFTLLGRLLEVATGTTYNAAMERLLLGPLGLSDSLLDHDNVRQRPYAESHIATEINGTPSLAVETPLWVPRWLDPAGGIWATTRDVIRYGRFHIDGGTATGAANIVSPASLRQMQQPVIPIPGIPIQMGMDWFVQDVAGTRVIAHGGDTLGQHTDFYAIPAQRFALIVLTNGQPGGSAVGQAAMDTALAQVPGLTPLVGKIGLSYALVAPANAPTVTLPANEVAAYAGRYANPGLVITFAKKGADLELSLEALHQPGSTPPAIQTLLPPPAPVAFLAKDMAVASGTRWPFVRDPAGRVQWVQSGLRLVPRATDGT